MLLNCYEGKDSLSSSWWSSKPSNSASLLDAGGCQDGGVRLYNRNITIKNPIKPAKFSLQVMSLIHFTFKPSKLNNKRRTLFPSYLQKSLLFHINTFYFTAIVELVPNYFTLDLTVLDRWCHYIFVHWLNSLINSHCKKHFEIHNCTVKPFSN